MRSAAQDLYKPCGMLLIIFGNLENTRPRELDARPTYENLALLYEMYER